MLFWTQKKTTASPFAILYDFTSSNSGRPFSPQQYFSTEAAGRQVGPTAEEPPGEAPRRVNDGPVEPSFDDLEAMPLRAP